MISTNSKRWWIGFCSAGAMVLLALGFVVFSVWVEDRHPSDDAQRALLPGAQRLVTKPIVNALSQQVERIVRNLAESPYMNTGLTLEETITRFLDARTALAARRIYAYRLARTGTAECLAALRQVLATAPLEHKIAIAQFIGYTGNTAVKALLWPMLEDQDERMVMAGIRGLSTIGGPEVVTRLIAILADPQYSNSVYVEAAGGLGAIGTPDARNALIDAFARVPSAEVATQILNRLGKFPFPTVAEEFQTYLATPETPPTLRVVAAEALAFSTPEAVPFLVELAASDSAADVRAAAAWAISAHNEDARLGRRLADLAEKETDATVRRRLYEAQLPQADVPGERLVPLVQAETDIAARVAGFNAIGHAVSRQPASPTTTVFDNEIVQELIRIATTPNSLNIQMRAVFALRRAGTPTAQSALATIASTAPPQIATAARNGIRTRNS